MHTRVLRVGKRTLTDVSDAPPIQAVNQEMQCDRYFKRQLAWPPLSAKFLAQELPLNSLAPHPSASAPSRGHAPPCPTRPTQWRCRNHTWNLTGSPNAPPLPRAPFPVARLPRPLPNPPQGLPFHLLAARPSNKQDTPSTATVFSAFLPFPHSQPGHHAVHQSQDETQVCPYKEGWAWVRGAGSRTQPASFWSARSRQPPRITGCGIS